jgi:hypothetical protein
MKLHNTGRNRKLLAGLVGVNLALALAVSAGAVPLPGGKGEVRAASVSDIEELAPPARQPGDAARELAQAAPAPSAVVAEVVPTSAPTTLPKPKTTAPPTTKALVAKAAAATAPPTAAPATAAPAAPVKVARRTPSPAEVQAAITELKRQVGGMLLLVSPTPAQLAQAGDQVCTAFDNGQSFAQVKATGLSMIPTSITVSPATADWAVRQAVTLYCPGHASKLV